MKRFMGLFVIVVISAFGASRLTSFSRNGISQDAVVQRETPTSIRKDSRLTTKQKKHSSLYKHYGEKLLDVAAKQSGNIEIEQDAESGFVNPANASRLPVLHSAVCNADAVVIGMLVSKTSQLTSEGNFVFTDYEMNIESVIKNNNASLIQKGEDITITRDGGTVEIDGRIFTAKKEDFKPTSIGNKYLFFLRYIPETNSYLAHGNGSYLLKGDKVVPLGNAEGQQSLGSTGTQAFLNEISSYATEDCR